MSSKYVNIAICFYTGLLTISPLAYTSTCTPEEVAIIQQKTKEGSTKQASVDDSPLAKEVTKLKLEKSKVDLQNALRVAKYETESAELQQEKDKLFLENELREAKELQLRATLEAEKVRLELENAIYTERQKKIVAERETERVTLEIQNAIQAEKNKAFELEIQLETTQLNFQMVKLEFEKAKNAADIEALNEKILERETKRRWDSQVNKPKEYLKDPFVDGYLVISDRRIPLNGPIFPGVAAYVTERIHYFNNKSSEYPIFIVIDHSPGGSVMEATRIIKSMQTSAAPVYVVVKSFAASAAAVITTLAERSFTYPNALVLHHQVWGFSWGNLTKQKEGLKFLEEWTQRFMKPVAKKMGITLEEFVKQMYEHNSSGNWREFAGEAVKLKWVDTIVKGIKETSYMEEPIEEEEEESIFFLSPEEKVDVQGSRYIKLPHLNPFDVYHLYNPDNYYRD